MESAFKDAFGQALMHSRATRCALVSTSMWLSSVMVLGPGFGALLHQVTLVLFGVFALVSGSFFVDVVQRVFIDFGQSLDCMFVDQLMVIIQGGLPVSLLVIVQYSCPFPGCQGRVPLASPELRLVAWCIRCSGGSAYVEYGDAGKVLLSDFFKQVLEGRSAAGLVPSLPNCGHLYNDLDWCGGVFRQGNNSCQQCSGFGLHPAGHACYGTESFQLPQ